jgi:glutathione S-transferase
MIELYYAPSTASLVVHWLLIELGLPHELRRLDLDAREQKAPEYLRLNPAGVVPTLVIDGQPICEAVAITQHLADTYSDGNVTAGAILSMALFHGKHPAAKLPRLVLSK